MNDQIDLLAFWGHHRAGTTWISDVIRQVCLDMGLNFAYVHNSRMFNFDLREFINREKIEFLAYTNADFEYVKQLENFVGFHVIRDPRDIVVSAYFSHLYSHSTDEWSELVEHRNKLEKLSKDDGLMLEMEFRRKEFEMMYNWDYSWPNIQEIKFEELAHNPYRIFLETFQFLGILDDSRPRFKTRFSFLISMYINNRLHRKSIGYKPFRVPIHKIPVERLLGIVYENDFSKKAGGRKPGEEDVKSHYRKGIAGDWRNQFNEEHKKFFKDHFNKLVVKLGYETNDKW